MKDIWVNSPPRSGNVYAALLLSTAFNYDIIVKHDLEFASTQNEQIYVVRNPYDCIASSIQRHLTSEVDSFTENETKFDITDIEKINEFIDAYCGFYDKFLTAAANNPNFVLSVDARFIMKDPLKFIDMIAERYGYSITYPHEDAVDLLTNVKNNLSKQGKDNHLTRVKTEDRKIIDQYVNNSERVHKLHDRYLLHLEHIAVDWKI